MAPYQNIPYDTFSIFSSSGRPNKGEYSGPINAQKCKLRKEKLKAKSNDFLTKEKEGLARWRLNLKKDNERYQKFKQNERLRK